ncbi:MAG: hypothetical protein KA792_10680, partial [Bacteroidales bacterium]|nr:hypothetical protein [Bacteroidales bacterium]
MPNNNIIILLIILLNLSSHSQTHIINKGNNEFKTIENNYNKFSFTNILNNIETVYDSSKNGIYLKLKIADYGNNLKIGEPELPVLRYLIEVPYNSQITVKIIKKTFKTIDLNQTDKQIFIKPAQASLSKNKNRDDIDFKINTKLYKTDSFYKASDSLVTIDLLGNMRGINIARLNIFPIEYNPVLNKLIVYDTLITEIIFKNADLKKTLSSKQTYFNSFYQSNSGFIKNYKTLNYKSQKTSAPLKYVIVSDPLFKESLTPFIKWKTQQGFNVIEVYTDQTEINRDSALIRQYLKELYLTATENNPPPSFILFAGDIQHIPAYKGKAKKQIYYTDLYYCEYTGDFLPDVLSGRFSASNVSEMQTIVQKTIEYEKFLFDDPTYLTNSVMIAGYDKNYSKLYCNGQISYAEHYYYNQQNGYILDKYLYPESSSKQEEILEKLNRGVGFINYTGHGSWDGWVNPAFFNYDIPLMQNKGKYPFIIGNACYTQSYERSACLGEALLRAADKGAIGYIGGTSETFWDEDYWWSVGFGAISSSSTYESNDLGVYDRLFHTHNEPFEDWAFTMSDIIFAGNLSVMQSGSEYTNLYWESYQLMGDPSLMPYLANPAKINMEYEDTILITASSLTIKTDPYIYIGLTQNDSLIGAVLSN